MTDLLWAIHPDDIGRLRHEYTTGKFHTMVQDPHPSWKECRNTAWLTAERVIWFPNFYFPNKEGYIDSDASPMLAPDLDVLRDESIAYDERMKKLGFQGEIKGNWGSLQEVLDMEKCQAKQRCPILMYREKVCPRYVELHRFVLVMDNMNTRVRAVPGNTWRLPTFLLSSTHLLASQDQTILVRWDMTNNIEPDLVKH
ncbi:hypothetical protein CONPUDRAFT_73684 [Coniophora puteana RWD-64-598 SS2]|uniref:Uncharacterized protein n=1 Tax=Coniophora puteana (strain RWD-64-598) TaxID=741705 RepID=A0A5M3MNI9_CONPW|nr:uncharacterized protein CONPUDRAFT_73684 [Coniophora puteana RWD-64-598 SS2]EIW80590.1 hypothetical protein CONPUDRAFT_73684 [Coniophora puteana RWD-64-598 SS2]